jgi:hypothetical protein
MQLVMLLQTTATPIFGIHLLHSPSHLQEAHQQTRPLQSAGHTASRSVTTGQNWGLEYGKYWPVVNSATCPTVNLIGVGAHILVLTTIITMIMMFRELVEIVMVVMNLLYHFF